MPLKLQLCEDNAEARPFEFEDSVERIRIGRDPETNEVVLPDSTLAASRQHCALERVLGRYRLILNGENPVQVDGQAGYDGQILPRRGKLRLGVEGPILKFENAESSSLPATALDPARRDKGMGKRIEELRSGSRRQSLTLVLLSLAVIGAAYFGWHLLQRSEEGLASELEVARAVLRTQIEESLRISEARSQRIQTALDRASPSVYMVMIQNQAGFRSPAGTAWVCGPDQLATNAHVAKILADLPDTWGLVVRSQGETPTEHRIASVTVHPGYDAFEALNQRYSPQVSVAMGWEENVRLLTACDVALLHVEDAQGLAPALSLASMDELATPEAGQPVGFIGFPSEKMINVNIERPAAVRQVGRLTSTTDFFFGAAPVAKRQLVQFSMPATGGASGSPVFDEEGRVIAVLCGGNVHSIVTGFKVRRDDKGNVADLEPILERAPLAVGVNFGQRVDMLSELIGGQAQSHLAAREASWSREFERYLNPSWALPDLAGHAWRARHRDASPLPEPVRTFSETLAGPGPGMAYPVKLDDLPAGNYLVIAHCPSRRDIDLHVVERESGVSNTVSVDELQNHWPQAVVVKREGVELLAFVVGVWKEPSDAAFELNVYAMD